MTTIMECQSKRHLPAKLAMASALLFGAVILSAGATGRHDDHRGGDRRGERGHDDRGRGGWGGGGYYPAPPIVYGNPGYYPPPVVYGPAIGIVLPGITIGIR